MDRRRGRAGGLGCRADAGGRRARGLDAEACGDPGSDASRARTPGRPLDGAGADGGGADGVPAGARALSPAVQRPAGRGPRGTGPGRSGGGPRILPATPRGGRRRNPPARIDGSAGIHRQWAVTGATLRAPSRRPPPR